MSIKKQFLKSESVCKVTFRVVNGPSLKAESVKIVGDFNGWNRDREPMKQFKSGDFTETLKLKPGKKYQFRYLVDDCFWDNEPEADGLIPNGIESGDYNSVILV
ncbi:isoamylase early set domain-containing protein [Sunxiuqinia sp. A32]|uniref:isoamylase early set domain-containing protein n=1 Tax=Sunxiuqinia sp. A32 TaxID=3461496 RepID=UPI0040451F4D